MSTIHCRRCDKDTEGFATAPLPGSEGAELLAHTCPACFNDWTSQEVMIINEYRLDLSLKRNHDLLNAEMAKFLSLPSGGGQAASGPPAQATPKAP